VDTAGSRGGERERERVVDCSKSSSDEDTSDDDGEKQSDDNSESQPVGEWLYLLEVMVPTSMFSPSLFLRD